MGKLKPEERKAVFKALMTLYGDRYTTAKNFFADFDNAVNRAKSSSSEAEKKHNEAILKGATKFAPLIAKFIQKILDLTYEKINNMFKKLSDLAEYIEKTDFSKAENRAALTAKIAEIQEDRYSVRDEFTKIHNVFEEGKDLGILKEDSIDFGAGSLMSNDEAIRIYRAAAEKCAELGNKETLDEDESKEFSFLFNAYLDVKNELSYAVEDQEQFRIETEKVDEELNIIKKDRGTPEPKPAEPKPDDTPAEEPPTEEPEETREKPEERKPIRDFGDPDDTSDDLPDDDDDSAAEDEEEKEEKKGKPVGGPEATPAEETPGEKPEGEKPEEPKPAEPKPEKPKELNPTDGFRAEYIARVAVINELINRLAATEKELYNNHSIIDDDLNVNYATIDEFNMRSNMSQSIEMQILAARKDLSVFEFNEYKKHPYYYAKLDPALAAHQVDYSKLNELYNDKPIQAFYDEHAETINNALAELEELRKDTVTNADKIAKLQEFVVAEKNAINRRLMGYAALDPSFNMREFLATNKGKLKPISKAEPTIEPAPERPTDPEPVSPLPEPGGEKPEKTGTTKSRVDILYKSLAEGFIKKYELEGLPKGMSFEDYFNANFINYLKEVKESLASSELNKYIKVDEGGKLMWVDKEGTVDISFNDFARYLMARRHELLKGRLKEELPDNKARIKFNPNKNAPEQVDRARATIVNAIISRSMIDGVGKKSVEVRSFFKQALTDAGLKYDLGGAKVSDQTVAATEGAPKDPSKDTKYEVIKEEGRQVWTIRVYGKDQDMSKAPLYEITMNYNPELAMDSGMRM